MARGRKPSNYPRRQYSIYLREDLVTAVDSKFLDPLTGKAQYGKRSELIEKLLISWLKGETNV